MFNFSPKIRLGMLINVMPIKQKHVIYSSFTPLIAIGILEMISNKSAILNK